MAEREQWGSRAGFIFAAVGSAIGLGNIWRFPYVVWDNGGGAFIVPYLFALLTAGIPVLVLEYSLGHRYRGSAPLTFRRLSSRRGGRGDAGEGGRQAAGGRAYAGEGGRKAAGGRGYEWLGWWQVAIAFVISTYYAVVLAWALAYTWFSVGQQWGDDPDGFLFDSYLQAAEPGEVGGLVGGVAIPLVLIWAVVLGVLFLGVRRGIERANKIFIPVLVVVFLVLVVRAVSLPGAGGGLDALFTPDWSALTDSSVWVAAYGQIFFSLSIGFAIMITYSSYLSRRSDLTNNGFIAGFGNASFELLAGLGVFAAIGFMAAQQGIGVDEVATEGVGLAFVVFPEIINTLPALHTLTGVLFFGSLVIAGVSSLISVSQTYIAGAQEKLGLSRGAAVGLVGGAAALLSLLYATNGGLFFLDAADHFINNFGIALAGLVQVIVVVWIARRLRDLRDHANEISDIRLGGWWTITLSVITPVLLGWMAIDNFVTVLTEGYEDYPTAFLLTAGWGVAAAALIVGVLLSLPRWSAGGAQYTEVEEVR
jgi:neurotransmitter:Na+ symporter, NSS family